MVNGSTQCIPEVESINMYYSAITTAIQRLHLGQVSRAYNCITAGNRHFALFLFIRSGFHKFKQYKRAQSISQGHCHHTKRTDCLVEQSIHISIYYLEKNYTELKDPTRPYLPSRPTGTVVNRIGPFALTVLDRSCRGTDPP